MYQLKMTLRLRNFIEYSLPVVLKLVDFFKIIEGPKEFFLCKLCQLIFTLLEFKTDKILKYLFIKTT